MESDPGPTPEPIPEPEALPAPEPALCPRCFAPTSPELNFCSNCGEPLRSGLARAPRRPTARQILSEVRRSTTPVKRTLAFYFVWLATGIAGALAAKAEAIAVHIMIAIDVVTFTATATWALAYRREVFKLYVAPRGGAIWLLIPVLAAWPIAAAISIFAGWINSMIGVDFKYTSLFFDHGYGWAWVILLICVQPAVVEELAFRGVILTTLRDVMKPGEAIVVSAVAFSIMHWSLELLVPFILLGSYLGWLRQRTNSLWPCMIAHFLHNFLVVMDEGIPILPG